MFSHTGYVLFDEKTIILLYREADLEITSDGYEV